MIVRRTSHSTDCCCFLRLLRLSEWPARIFELLSDRWCRGARREQRYECESQPGCDSGVQGRHLELCAEFGRASCGVVLIQTKSGSNNIHGSGFFFYRPTDTAANNNFAPAGSTPLSRRTMAERSADRRPMDTSGSVRPLAYTGLMEPTSRDTHRSIKNFRHASWSRSMPRRITDCW
jgi:hypothetical protein